MTLVLLVLALGAVIAVAVPFYRIWKTRQAEAALREQPPETVRFQVKLPADAAQSNMLMTRFWDRIHRHLPADDKSVEGNTNTLHAALVGYGTQPGRAPRVSFVVWCHPSLSEKLQLDLSECYNSEAQIITVDEDKDPFGQWMIDYRAGVEYRRMMAEAARADDDDDE